MLVKFIKCKKGLSLVEVLLASALLILVFTGFINAFYYSMNIKVNSQSRLQAILTAQACLEEMRGTRGEGVSEWSNLDELKAWLVDDKGYAESDSGVYIKDNVVITLISSDPGIPDELIPVHVEVSYEDQMNKEKKRSVTLATRLREF